MEPYCDNCGTPLYEDEGPFCGTCAAEADAAEQEEFERMLQHERDLEQAQDDQDIRWLGVESD